MELSDELMLAIRDRVEKEKHAAYAQGWRDAIAAVAKSAAALTDAPIMRGVDAPSPIRTPREKSAQWYVLETLKGQPNGLKTVEVAASAYKNGLRTSVAAMRVALTRLQEKKLITLNEGKWFPA